MSDMVRPGWPTFELVRIPASPDVPQVAMEMITSRGVPGGLIGYEYRVLDRMQIVPGDPMRNLIAFGSSGLRGRICLDLETLAVVHVPNPDVGAHNCANVRIEKFIECVAAVIERFPFYSEDADLDDWERSADELGVAISAIDETVSVHNGFWETFLDDIRIGDYSTEMILGGADDEIR